MATRRSTRRRTSTRRRRKTNGIGLSGRAIRELLALGLVILAIVSVIALFAPDSGAVVKPLRDALSKLLGGGSPSRRHCWRASR